MSTSTSPENEVDVVAVRRNVWLSGVVAGLAVLVGLAYLLRGSSVLDTVVGAALLVLALMHGAALRSSRAPVLVADEQGIRLRIGVTWRGLPWGSVRQVVVEHGDNLLHEGRLVVVPRDPGSTLDHLGVLGRLHLRWNQLWYGAPLSVPLGMTTRTDTADVAGELTALAGGRTDVVQLRGRQLAQLDEVPARPDVADPEPVDAGPVDTGSVDTGPLDAGPVDTGSVDTGPLDAGLDAGPVEPGRVEPGPVDPELDPASERLDQLEDDSSDGSAQDEATEPVAEAVLEVPVDAPAPVAPVRPLNRPARAEVRLEVPAIASHPSGLVPAQRRHDEAGRDVAAEAPDLEHAETWEDIPVVLVTEDLAVHPPIEPVIGPKIVTAREMLGMSIEELSRRTRIRPHVIEAIEVDEFGPCGGDFYARGHLTAIARVLGLDGEPLLKEYDDRYAHGPINARRVFEAELATGLSGGMRATAGGPRWTLLVGSVLCLTMIWGVARVLAGDPEQLAAPPTASSESAGLAANQQPITSPLMKTTPMTVTAAHAGAHVVVRDRTGRVLWSGDLRMTGHRRVVGLAPFKVESDNGGAIEVSVAGRALGTVGVAGKPGAKRFG